MRQDPRWNGQERFTVQVGGHLCHCIPKGFVPPDPDDCSSVATTEGLGSLWADSGDDVEKIPKEPQEKAGCLERSLECFGTYVFFQVISGCSFPKTRARFSNWRQIL